MTEATKKFFNDPNNDFDIVNDETFLTNVFDSDFCFWYIQSGTVIVNCFDNNAKLPVFRILTLTDHNFLWGIKNYVDSRYSNHEESGPRYSIQAKIKPNTTVYKISVNKLKQKISGDVWNDIIDECNKWIYTFTENLIYLMNIKHKVFEVNISKETGNNLKNGVNIVSKNDILWINNNGYVEYTDKSIGKKNIRGVNFFSKIKLFDNKTLDYVMNQYESINNFPVSRYHILSIFHEENMSDALGSEVLETVDIFSDISTIDNLLNHILVYNTIIFSEVARTILLHGLHRQHYIESLPENNRMLNVKNEETLQSILYKKNQLVHLMYKLAPIKILQNTNTILNNIKDKLNENNILQVLHKHVNRIIDNTVNTRDLEKETQESNEDSLLKATRIVANHLKIKVRINETDYERIKYLDVIEKLNSISRSSNFRFRAIKLENKWFNNDQGPILAFNETGTPVALIPYKKNAYIAVNSENDSKIVVNHSEAEKFMEDAYIFYCPFPEEKTDINVSFLLKFGMSHLKKDLWLLIIIGIFIGILSNLVPFATGKILNSVIPFSERDLLWQYAIALIVGAIASFSFEISRHYSVYRIQTKLEYLLQSAVWDRLLKLPLNFFRKFTAGELSENVSGIAKIRDMIAGTCVSALLSGTSSIFLLIMMFYYSVHLTLAGIALTTILISYSIILNYAMLINQKKEIEIHSKLSGFVFELMRGISKIRVNAAEVFAFNKWANRYKELRHFSINVEKIDNYLAVLQAGFPIFSNIILFSIIVYLQNKYPDKETLTTGEFVAFLSSYGIFLSAMLSISDASMNFFRVKPVYEKLKPILTAPLEIDKNAFHPGDLTGKIEVKHLSFRYNPNDNLILKDISFNIEPGDFVAFVGESGSGKSTLFKLLLGLEKPDSGVILYDDQDLSNLFLQEVRHQIGVVMQNSQVRPTTIFENIAGISSITEDEAWLAAEKVGLREDIEDMPMKMTTLVSENGSNLSGGQKQRLMIANAIAKNPKIIFLDEATSALDNKTQKTVIESLEKQKITRIAIAHRLSTIENAKKIFVLDNGRIVEAGTYEELEKKTHFQKIAARQKVHN